MIDMQTDFHAHIPQLILDHAARVEATGTQPERSALLTGTVIGHATGQQAFYQALSVDAQQRAEAFAYSLGPRVRLPEEKPSWDRARLRPCPPPTLTGSWRSKPVPVIDRKGPWPVVIPPTQEMASLTTAA